MKQLEEFAQGGSSSGTVRWEPYLEKTIQQYVESNSVLRDLCYIYRLNGTYTANIPRNYSTGSAVEVVEGAEIPAVRQVMTTVDVRVAENGTAIEMTDESKMLDWYGDLVARELQEAAKRMLRKENADIMDVFVDGAGSSADGLGDDVLTFEDLLAAKVYLRERFYNPDTVFVNPNQYADLVKDDRFIDLSQSGTTDPLRQGTIGGSVAGMRVVEIPEIPNKTVLVVDMSENPLWLVVLQDIQVEQFRIPDRRSDKVQMTAYEKPAVLKPEVIRKISIKAT